MAVVSLRNSWEPHEFWEVFTRPKARILSALHFQKPHMGPLVGVLVGSGSLDRNLDGSDRHGWSQIYIGWMGRWRSQPCGLPRVHACAKPRSNLCSAFICVPGLHRLNPPWFFLYIFKCCLAQFVLFGKMLGWVVSSGFWATLKWFEPFSSHHQ